MSLRTVFLILISLSIISCGSKKNGEQETVNGIKIFKNDNNPSDRTVKLKAEFLFKLNEDTGDTTDVIRTVSAIKTDEAGNIYVLDRRKAKIFKFDPAGSLIKAFGQQGNGPGEMMRPMELLASGDSIFVADQRLRKILVFNSGGEFVRDIIPLRDNGLPQSLVKLDGADFAGLVFNMTGGRGPGPRDMTISVSILDKKFEKVIDMFSKKIEVDFHNFNPMDHQSKFAAGGGKIYIAENTEDKVQINIFDYAGKKTEEIRKSYAKVMYSDSEKEQLKKTLERRFRGPDDLDMDQFRYKKSVENIFFHKDGYLLLETARKTSENDQTNFVLDIFKDGVYLNTIDLNSADPEFYSNPDGYEKMFIGDKLFVFNPDDNVIYAYSIKIGG
jgi:hypothetical protein